MQEFKLCRPSKYMMLTKVYSHSPEPWKLCGVCIAINYTPHSMAYYAYEMYSYLLTGKASGSKKDIFLLKACKDSIFVKKNSI